MKKISIKNYSKLIQQDEDFVHKLIKKDKVQVEKSDGKVKVLVDTHILKMLKSTMENLIEAELKLKELKKPKPMNKKAIDKKSKTIIKKKVLKPKKKLLKKRSIKKT